MKSSKNLLTYSSSKSSMTYILTMMAALTGEMFQLTGTSGIEMSA